MNCPIVEVIAVVLGFIAFFTIGLWFLDTVPEWIVDKIGEWRKR